MRLNHDLLGLDSTYKNNKYRLSLMHVVGSTALHTTFSADFFFMKNENEESYSTAVGFLHKLFHINAFPKVLAVDQELDLISALQYQFSESSILLCVWHIEKNVTKNCKGILGSYHARFMKD